MHASVRLSALCLDTPFHDRMARLGGRCFVARSGPGEGDIFLTLPAEGAQQVLVPRGLGSAVVARASAGGWCAEGSGVRLAASRWSAAGALAGWVRNVRLPAGPVRALPLPAEPAAGGGWHVRVLPAAVEWAAARRSDPAAGRGAVVVAGARVVGVSPGARACGIVRGMSLPLARRKCAGLRQVAPVVSDTVRARIEEVVNGELAEALACRGGFAGRTRPMTAHAAVAFAERLALRLWQAAGVEARIALAATERAATRLARILEPGQVAVAPPAAAAVWEAARPSARIVTSVRRGAWSGASVPDVEGVLALSQRLAPGTGGALRIRLRGERRTLSVAVAEGARSPAARVEGALRAVALDLGPVTGLEVEALRNTARVTGQLPLLPAMR